MTKNTPMRKDWMLLGLAMGTGASLLKSIVNSALVRVGVPTERYSTMAGALFMGTPKRSLFGSRVKPRRFSDWAVSNLADLALGGAFGAGMAYVMSKTPPGNEAIKGAAMGGGVWASTVLIGRAWNVDSMRSMSSAKMLSMLATNLLFGAAQGIVFGKYGSQLVTQSHPDMVKVVSDGQFDQGRLRLQ